MTPPTEMLYLENTYLFEGRATVASVTTLEDGTTDIALERTVFYPQGGGQPCDHGTIATPSGTLAVTRVALDPDGIIHHTGALTGSMEAGQSAELAVDAERRTLNARNHSAGHLIDVAVSELGLPGLRPSKGYHFPDGPYLEYEGEITDPDTVAKRLDEVLARLIAADIAMKRRMLPYDQAMAAGIHAPPGKSARTVNFAGYPACGCGGTHVRSTGELIGVSVRKISWKKGMTRISYALA